MEISPEPSSLCTMRGKIIDVGFLGKGASHTCTHTVCALSVPQPHQLAQSLQPLPSAQICAAGIGNLEPSSVHGVGAW